MAEFIEVLSDQAKKDIDMLISKLEQGTKAVAQMNKEFKNIKVPSQTSKAINNNAKATNKLTEAQKEARRLSRALERQKERLRQATSKENKELLKLRYETQQTNKEQKQAQIISQRLGTAYDQLQAEVGQLSKRYRDLATKQQLGIKLTKQEENELKDVTRQINRKQTALKRVDANMQVYNRNVGNYKSAWRGVGGLLKASIGAFGAFAAVDIARQIFTQTREINKLNASLKQVTDSQSEFNETIEFITQLADRSGTSINKLQQAYTKFRASAKVTNLSLEEQRDIFENIATASGLLGLSTEDTEGAFRALEQMMSKGNIQAEEIRGQLGERLPGAFVILAKSMGLTTQELNKQLELGNVIAEDVLPKFAKELAKTYSFDNTTRVETLAAAQARLGNEWNLFLRDLEGGEGTLSGIFQGLLNLLSFFIKRVRELSNFFSEFFESFEPIFKNIREQFILVFGEEGANRIATFFGQLIKFMSSATWKMFGFTLKGIGATINGMLNSTLQLAQNLGMVARSMGVLISAFKNFDFLSPVESAKRVSDAQIKLLATFAVAGQNLGKSFKDGFNEVWNFEAEVLPENTNTKGNKKAEETGRKLVQAIKQGVENESPEAILSGINLLVDDDLENYQKLRNEIEQTTKSIMDLMQAQKNANVIFSELDGLASMFNIDIGVLRNAYETINDENATAEERLESIANTTSEVFGGVAQTILANENARIQEQIALNNDYYNNLIQQAQGNEAQQEALRQEAQAKERQLRRKQAENEKKMALFDIAINTATAVIKALPNIPLSIAIGAIGAAKAAIVASRPIPQFKHGRKGGEETWAILGDGYKNEPIIDKEGNLKGISPNKPTLMHLDKGDSVLPSTKYLDDDVISKTMLWNVQANANRMSDKSQNKGLEQILNNYSTNLEKRIIKSLQKANFVNNNKVDVDLGYATKVNRYKGY